MQLKHFLLARSEATARAAAEHMRWREVGRSRWRRGDGDAVEFLPAADGLLAATKAEVEAKNHGTIYLASVQLDEPHRDGFESMGYRIVSIDLPDG